MRFLLIFLCSHVDADNHFDVLSTASLLLQYLIKGIAYGPCWVAIEGLVQLLIIRSDSTV